MRVMAVCHDSVGIGHLRRTLAIAGRAAVSIPSCQVLVVSGALHASHFALPDRVDYVKLPSITKGPDYRYCAKSLGTNFQGTLVIRSAVLTATAASFRPDVFLIDKSPMGVGGEAQTALQLARDRSPHTRVVFGMRDIEDAPEQTIQEWKKGRHLDALKHLVDEIRVYGDRHVFDVAEAYQLPPEIAEKLHYTGYIARPPCAHAREGRAAGDGPRRLLVTVGGGTDGARLIGLYLRDPLTRVNGDDVVTTIAGGPDLPRPLAGQYRRRAAELKNVRFEDVRPCMFCEYCRSDAVLCMGGYNTMVELLQARRPMVVYPRVVPRLEQYICARRFAALGLCTALEPNVMTPQAIRDALIRAMTKPADPPVLWPDLDGLTRVARRLSELEAPIRDSVAVFV